MLNIIRTLFWIIIGLCLAFLRNYLYMFQLAMPVFTLVFVYGMAVPTILKLRAPKKYLAVSLIIGLILFDIPGSFTVYSLEQLVVFCAGILLTSFKYRRVYKYLLGALGIILIYLYNSYSSILTNHTAFFEAVPDRTFEFIGDGYEYFPKKNGKVKVVDLWFIDCAPCRKQLTYMEDFKQAYLKDPNFEYLTFNISKTDSKSRIRSMLSELNLNIVVGRDSTSFFQSFIGISSYPQLLIIDRNNQLRYVYNGFPQENTWLYSLWLRKTIADLESEPLESETLK